MHIRLRCRDGLLFYHSVTVQLSVYIIVHGTNFCKQMSFNNAANIDKHVASNDGVNDE